MCTGAYNISVPQTADTIRLAVAVQIAPALSPTYQDVTEPIALLTMPFLTFPGFRAHPSVFHVTSTSPNTVEVRLTGPVAIARTIADVMGFHVGASLLVPPPFRNIPTATFPEQIEIPSSLSEWSPHVTPSASEFTVTLKLNRSQHFIDEHLPKTIRIDLWPALFDGIDWIYLPQTDFPPTWAPQTVDITFINGTKPVAIYELAVPEEPPSSSSSSETGDEPAEAVSPSFLDFFMIILTSTIAMGLTGMVMGLVTHDTQKPV